MVPLEKETNIEVLRSVSLWLREELTTALKKLDHLDKKDSESRQDWLDQELKDQVLKLQERFYGFGRETLSEDRPQSHQKSLVASHTESEHRTDELKNLPNADELPVSSKLIYKYKMSKEELGVESMLRNIAGGASAWEEIPRLTQDSFEITVFQRVIRKVKHEQAKYRLKKEFNKLNKEVILTARGPAKLRTGNQYSIAFATDVAIEKYLYHTPLERQRRKFETAGFRVDVKTLYSLCEAVSEHCAFVIPMIKQEILSDFTASHLDETPWHILGSETQGYMWALSNRRGSYYQFEGTRSGMIAEEILKNYSGSIITDGFSGYNRFKKRENIRIGHCWSHVRREFFDILKNYPQPALEIVKLIDQLFEIERRGINFEVLSQLRATESQIITIKIKDWLYAERPKHLPQSGIVKAINYALNHWPELTLFLKDLSVPLTNNDAERALRHVVMGRKNFNGSKTINGADVAANIYTVIESAKKAGIDPKSYIEYLIDARWFNDKIKTPWQYATEKHPERKPKFPVPPKDQWQIAMSAP